MPAPPALVNRSDPSHCGARAYRLYRTAACADLSDFADGMGGANGNRGKPRPAWGFGRNRLVTRLSKAGFSKMPVSSMLVWGSQSHTITKETGMDAQATFSCSFTQTDLGPVAELPSLPHWPAQRLLPQERQDLAIQVLAGDQPVSDLAREHEVSRKFLYQQAQTAQDALTRPLTPNPKPRRSSSTCRSPRLAQSPASIVSSVRPRASSQRKNRRNARPQSACDAAPLCNGPDRSAKSRGVIDGCSESARCVIILS